LVDLHLFEVLYCGNDQHWTRNPLNLISFLFPFLWATSTSWSSELQNTEKQYRYLFCKYICANIYVEDPKRLHLTAGPSAGSVVRAPSSPGTTDRRSWRVSTNIWTSSLRTFSSLWRQILLFTKDPAACWVVRCIVNPVTPTLTSTLAPTTTTHPISMPYFPTWCIGPEICASRPACKMNWISSRSHLGKTATATGRFAMLSFLVWGMLRLVMILTRPLSCPMWGRTSATLAGYYCTDTTSSRSTSRRGKSPASYIRSCMT
jgi:hypothetical protein